MKNANPYTPTKTIDAEASKQETQPGLLRLAIAGAAWSITSAFPIAGLMALAFRFPVPMVGYMSGPKAVVPAMFAVVFYGVFMGGLVLVGVLGGLVGILSAGVTSDPRRRRRFQRWSSIAISTALLLVLATLDWFIGAW